MSPVRSRLARALCLAGLTAGCSVYVPSVQVVTLAVPAPPRSTPASSAPWSSPTPTPSPSEAVPQPRSFSGNGPAERLGPVTLARGHFSLHVRYDPAIAGSGAGPFALQLEDREGRFVATLASEDGAFDRTTSPAVEIADDYYLSVPQADGAWTIDLTPGG